MNRIFYPIAALLMTAAYGAIKPSENVQVNLNQATIAPSDITRTPSSLETFLILNQESIFPNSNLDVIVSNESIHNSNKPISPLPEGTFTISSGYGMRVYPFAKQTGGPEKKFHYGVDYAAPKGTDVLANDDNLTVKETGYKSEEGNYVILQKDSLEYYYYHLLRHSILVKEGQPVRKGQKIGEVGSTGRSTGPHLHLGKKRNGEWVNPLN